MRSMLFLSIIAIMISSCLPQKTSIKKTITDINDYQWALNEIKNGNPFSIKNADIVAEISFWKEQINAKGDVSVFHNKIGNLYNELFDNTGDIAHIYSANMHFTESINRCMGNYKANGLLALSANHIKLHRFNEALEFSEESFDLSKNKVNSALMAFDAAMEIGEYQLVDDIMDQYASHTSFDYLVRYAKYADHNGDLTEAINAMEKAHKLVKGKNEKLENWSMSSLAEMYGHNGEIQKSYSSFLSILRDNPSDLHSLKSIAWIAYSHDGKREDAAEILTTITKVTQLPDAEHMLSEIMTGDIAEEYQKQFITSAERPKHYNLYKSYLIDYYLSNEDCTNEAMDIAQEEIQARRTPSTYLQLAKAHHHLGQNTLAKDILQDHVISHTYEPNILYEAGMLLVQMDEKKAARHILSQVADAKFELGPTKANSLDLALKSI